MRKVFLFLLLVITGTVQAQTDPYQNAWKALNENKRIEAEKWLLEAMKNPAVFEDAYISELYLKSYNGKENQVTDFISSFYEKVSNPSPYIFALWFNQAVLGEHGKKYFDHQVQLMDRLIRDEKVHGTIAASANYQKASHLLYSNDFVKARDCYDAIGEIRNWQYTGPFENLSESGFFKNYGPPDHPETTAVFKSLTNADVKWITPPTESRDGWITSVNQFANSTAVIYAQSFVTAAADQDVYCNVGVTGAVKVWINDELLVAEAKERKTDYDTYTVPCRLKAGTNRVLVQLSFTNLDYPCFTIRFTNEKFKSIPGLHSAATFAPYPKATGSVEKKTLLPHFAEEYFQNKISRQPGNLLNYLLLADVYLRNKKILEARNLLTEAMLQAPDNCLLKMKMVEVLIKENNRTLLLEEVEKIKQADAESLVILDMKIKEDFTNQKFEDGARTLEKRIALYGEDLSTAAYKIQLLAEENKYDELVKEAEKIFEQYPGIPSYVKLMYTIKKEVYKDIKAGMKVYEDFMKKNYDYQVYQDYAALLKEQGKMDKALAIKKELTEKFPFSPGLFYNISTYHYTAKEYDQAEKYVRQSLALSPYNPLYWEQLGDIKNEKNNKSEALAAYNQSLQYDPNQYNLLNKIRKLDGKSESFKLFPETDISKIIREDKPEEAKNTDYGYYFLLDEKNVIVHNGGATEQYFTTVIRITNQKGIDRYKESSISYTNSQSLLIEKAEVVKKNQSKIEGERNGNEIVFTNLEAGDVLVFKYRLQSFVYGRFTREFWDNYFFGGQIYTVTTRYNLLVPAGREVNYTFLLSAVKPVIKTVEDFTAYSWEVKKAEPEKEESLMPGITDISPVLHISTIADWKVIADWYRDISNNKAEEDFEIKALYKQLFPDGSKPMSQFQKAKLIYEYIGTNIRYSSVSFRQSAFVPQRASATLTTRLGDCKDLSSLFVTLAHMAGIEAQMVLVDTRDNGEKHILLPGIEFNHCIVKAVLDNKKYYIELTDNYLPFTSLPNNVIGALILEIPSKNIQEKAELKYLSGENRIRDVVKRFVEIKPADADLDITVQSVKYGNLAADIRYTYLNLDPDNQVKELEKSVASSYKNNVKLTQVHFTDLDKYSDSVVFSYTYRVKNEVMEIGTLKTFRIGYPDLVASLDNFSADSRLYPVEYRDYEGTDRYETTITISAPPGKKFTDIPSSESLTFKDMHYMLQYRLKAPDKLIVSRTFTNNRHSIPAADYPAFKNFFEKIVKAEQKFIIYK